MRGRGGAAAGRGRPGPAAAPGTGAGQGRGGAARRPARQAAHPRRQPPAFGARSARAVPVHADRARGGHAAPGGGGAGHRGDRREDLVLRTDRQERTARGHHAAPVAQPGPRGRLRAAQRTDLRTARAPGRCPKAQAVLPPGRSPSPCRAARPPRTVAGHPPVFRDCEVDRERHRWPRRAAPAGEIRRLVAAGGPADRGDRGLGTEWRGPRRAGGRPDRPRPGDLRGHRSSQPGPGHRHREERSAVRGGPGALRRPGDGAR
ncbi:hypothetical protein SGPA1_20714 [Streptomyces misionensis JCM 4497]